MKRTYSNSIIIFFDKFNVSNKSLNQGQCIKEIDRDITTVDKPEQDTNSFQSVTFWSCSNSDIHKAFFERCIDTFADSTALQLIKLRRVNKSFKEWIEDCLHNYIEAAYKADAKIPFSIFECIESEVYFPPCFNIYLHKAFMLYFYAHNYLQNKACNAYRELFESNLKKWTIACSDSKFTYEIVNTDNKSFPNSCCRISINDRSIELNNQKPLEAYLISEFLNEYIGSKQIILDYANKDRVIKLFNLIQLLDSYRPYDGIGMIMSSLMYSIKERINSNELDLGTGLLLLSSVMGRNILVYQENWDDLVPLVIKGINDDRWKTQANAIGLFHQLLRNGIIIGHEDLEEFLSFMTSNAFNCKSPLQVNALVILCDLAMQGISIGQDDFDRFLPLIIKIVRDSRWDVKLNAQTFLYQLLCYDVIIPEDTLKELIPCVIANLRHPEEKIRPTALALLTQLVTVDVLWSTVSADLLNSIFVIFQHCSFCNQLDIEIFPPTFLILTQHPKAEIAYLAKDIFDFLDQLENNSKKSKTEFS